MSISCSAKRGRGKTFDRFCTARISKGIGGFVACSQKYEQKVIDSSVFPLLVWIVLMM
jgi:hypothetical protein